MTPLEAFLGRIRSAGPTSLYMMREKIAKALELQARVIEAQEKLLDELRIAEHAQNNNLIGDLWVALKEAQQSLDAFLKEVGG